MTTRDPRSRSNRPDSGSGRDPTQSLSIDADYEDSHPSLALGTADAKREERTKIESPQARSKTPVPAAPPGKKPPPIPRGGTEEPDRVGTTVGSYKILEQVGKGGMGFVFRAEHVKLGREVALKLLRADYARRKDAVARFTQEARTVNRVRHRNIVDVPDILELDDGTTCIVMEYLRGQSLGKWARTGVDLPRALAVLVQICDGLGAAHQVGVVHRDLKPDNIIVVPTSDGAELVKLLDFGVAKLLNRDDEDIGFQTAAGSVIGTPAYMSPEQAGGMTVDARSDIYSLGAIMYELFCGTPMFRGRSFGEYVRKHLTEMPVPPRATEQGRGIDPLLEALILRCLEKDPDRRFPNILELRDALLGMLGGMETHPPGFASLSVSGIQASMMRGPMPMAMPPMPMMQMPVVMPQGVAPSAAAVAPTVMPHAVPTMAIHQSQGLPMTPPMMQLPTPMSGQSHLSGQNPMYYTNAGYSQMMAPPVQVTPWWVWFVGGALAVGLGIAAAVWYANRSASTEPIAATPVKVQPTTTPIEPPPSSNPPQFIELRFESEPGGDVFAEGMTTALCHTPCATKLDLKDGGSIERRAFVVRSPGFKDSRLDVDLKGAQREFKVTLDREQTVTEVKPSPSPTVEETKVTEKTNGKVGKSGKSGKTGKITKKDETQPESKTTEAKPLPTFQDKPETVDVKKPDQGKKPDKIDPSDTLDPFHKKTQ